MDEPLIADENSNLFYHGRKKSYDTNEEYHAKKEYASSSMLKSIYKRSLFHYFNHKMGSSAALTIGSAFHALVLEPHVFEEEFAIAPKFDRRTKIGKAKFKEFEAEVVAQNKDIITEADYEMICNMRDQIMSDPTCSGILANGEPEVSFYIEDFHGIKVRVRPDFIGSDYIVDLKSCQDACPAFFSNDIRKFGWKLQAAFYADALGVDKFYFLASEKKQPFACQLYLMSPESMEEGRRMYLKSIADWKRYLETGIQTKYQHPNLKDGVITL